MTASSTPPFNREMPGVQREAAAKPIMASTRITIGSNARLFPGIWRPALDEIAFAQSGNFECLQFPGQEHGLDAERLGAPIPVVARALAAANLGAVMEIVVRLTTDGRTRAGKDCVAVLEANLPAITTLRCSHVHLHLARADWYDLPTCHALEATVIPQLAACVALAVQHGIRLGIEHNEPDLCLLAAPDRCALLLDAVPGLGFVWDLNHTTPDHLPGYLALIPRMQMLHVADTPLPEVNHHLPLGLGSIDFPAYFAALLDGGFAGPAILEIGGLPKSGGYGRDTDEALIESRSVLLAAINTARNALH